MEEPVFARTGIDREAEDAREFGVVPDLGVCIQGQMVADEVHAVFNEAPDAAPFDADNPRILAAPEPAVMHENGVGALRCGSLNEPERCAYPQHNRRDVFTTLNLKSVRSIISEFSGLQDAVQKLDEGSCLHLFSPFLKSQIFSRPPW